MNTLVNFSTAKLLKEKGFDVPTSTFYFKNGAKGGEHSPFNWNQKDLSDCSRPTIAEVITWLYEKHGIWVITVPQGLSTTWVFSLFNVEPEKGRIIFDSPSFNSLTEAYEAAITYILNNLI